MHRILVVVWVSSFLGACNGDEGPESLYPKDYATTFQEVRNCRFSVDHDLVRMRVLASADAVSIYQARTGTLPEGAILLKEQYDSSDKECGGPIINYTVMRKLPAGAAPNTLDWEWQKTDHKHGDVTGDVMRCTRCHTSCGKPPEGFDGTCTMP